MTNKLKPRFVLERILRPAIDISSGRRLFPRFWVHCYFVDLTVRSHTSQRAAVRWMMDREAHDKSVLRDPCWRQFISENGFKFWGCTVTGAFSIETPRKIRDTRGGFFCDEPVCHPILANFPPLFTAQHIGYPKMQKPSSFCLLGELKVTMPYSALGCKIAILSQQIVSSL